MKINVSPVVVRGKRKFSVSYGRGKERVRRFFKTRAEAEAEKESLGLQQAQAGDVWLSLAAAERNELIAVFNDARLRGVSLRDALNAFQPDSINPKGVLSAFDDFIADRKRALVSSRTLKAYKSNVGRFAHRHTGKMLHDLVRSDVSDFLVGLNPRTFNTYLTSLNTFFLWGKKQGHLKESPSSSLEKISSRRMGDLDKEPAILSVEDCARLLSEASKRDKGLLAYISVCLFAGLRPEREAGRLSWEDVSGDAITVKGVHAKDRQRRHVTIRPVLAEWLRLRGDLPVRNLRKRFEAVRDKAELWDDWQQDCLRHTFASCSLVKFGVEATMRDMGHGDYDMLFRHYRALVTPEQAEAFWSLTPEKVV